MEFRILLIYTSLWIWIFLVLKIAGSVNSPSVCQQSDVPSLSEKFGEAEFNVTFNLNNWASYERCIQELRDKKQLEYRASHNRPVLYPEKDKESPEFLNVNYTKFFDVILKANNGQVTVRIRRENLYVVGYKNANNQWLEFNDFSPTHLINGSTFLDYSGSYISLEKYAGGRDKIALSKEQLNKAVNDLATSADTRTRATGLIIVIQMVSESMRFRNISTFLATSTGNPPTWVIAQENAWGHISQELLHIDSDPTHKFNPPSPATGIKDVPQAVEAIGMIKYFNFSRINGWNMEANNEGEYPQANPMVEVA